MYIFLRLILLNLGILKHILLQWFLLKNIIFTPKTLAHFWTNLIFLIYDPKKCPKQKNKTTFTSPTFLVQNVKVVLFFSFLAILTIFQAICCMVEEIPKFQEFFLSFLLFLYSLWKHNVFSLQHLKTSYFHWIKCKKFIFEILKFPLHCNKLLEKWSKWPKIKKIRPLSHFDLEKLEK